MKKTLIIIFIIAFAALFNEPPDAAEKKPKGPKLMDNYIAVFDVETEGVDKKISKPLTESIRHELVMSGKWEVIDRGNMNKILGEQKFQFSGCVQGQCIVEAGQLLGVGKIVTGSVSIVGKTYYLTLSLINVETGKIENVSEDKCKCELDDLIDSTKRLVKRLFGEKVETAQPLEEEPGTKEPSKKKFSLTEGEGSLTTLRKPKNFLSGKKVRIRKEPLDRKGYSVYDLLEERLLSYGANVLGHETEWVDFEIILSYSDS